jgi:hypothetical protein
MTLATWLRTATFSWMAAAGLALAVPALALAAEDKKEPAAEKPADPPKAPEAKPEQTSGGLQATLLLKERTFRMGGGNNAQELKIKQPTIQLKNVGDKPVVLDFPLPEGGGFGGRGGPGGGGGNEPTGVEAGPVRIFVKPAEGGDGAKRDDKPITLVVLKPGQVVEQPLAGLIRFPADGKYLLRFEVDVPARDEVIPGIKPWSGKLKSNELEYDYQGMFGGRGNFGGNPGGGPGNPGGRGNRGGGQAPAPIPGDQGEAF